MTNNSQKNFFDSFARQQNPGKLIQEFRKPPRVNLIQRDFVFGVLNPKKGEKILELGAGIGLWSIPLLALGCDVTVVDISSVSLSLLKKMHEYSKKQ
ncbi:MAG: hypothetical protein AB1465_05340 [Patescibacteria group bacterium]